MILFTFLFCVLPALAASILYWSYIQEPSDIIGLSMIEDDWTQVDAGLARNILEPEHPGGADSHEHGGDDTHSFHDSGKSGGSPATESFRTSRVNPVSSSQGPVIPPLSIVIPADINTHLDNSADYMLHRAETETVIADALRGCQAILLTYERNIENVTRLFLSLNGVRHFTRFTRNRTDLRELDGIYGNAFIFWFGLLMALCCCHTVVYNYINILCKAIVWAAVFAMILVEMIRSAWWYIAAVMYLLAVICFMVVITFNYN